MVVSVLIPAVEQDPRTDLYVFGLYGQSNAAYYATDLSLVQEVSPIPPGNAFYFGTKNQPITYDGADPSACSIYDMCPGGSWSIGNYEPSFARAMYEAGKKCLLINFGIPGYNVSALMPGGSAWAWENDVISTALSKIDTAKYRPVMCGIISTHGEADSGQGTTESDYIDKFMATFDALKTNYGFDCVIMNIVRDIRGVTIQDAQYKMIEDYPNVILGCNATESFTVANGLMRSDDLHYSQLGDNILGADDANSWLNSSFVKDSASFDYSPLISAIPLIVISAIVLGIVAIVVKSRD